MRLIGLTGGIGSGKSTVARLFAERGAIVVDADQVAREVVEPGEPALAEIVEHFGPDVVDAEGRLDRPALAAVVFGDDEAQQHSGCSRVGSQKKMRSSLSGGRSRQFTCAAAYRVGGRANSAAYHVGGRTNSLQQQALGTATHLGEHGDAALPSRRRPRLVLRRFERGLALRART